MMVVPLKSKSGLGDKNQRAGQAIGEDGRGEREGSGGWWGGWGVWGEGGEKSIGYAKYGGHV